MIVTLEFNRHSITPLKVNILNCSDGRAQREYFFRCLIMGSLSNPV